MKSTMCSSVRCGAVRCGAVWCGAVRCGAGIEHGQVRPTFDVDVLDHRESSNHQLGLDVAKVVKIFGHPDRLRSRKF